MTLKRFSLVLAAAALVSAAAPAAAQYANKGMEFVEAVRKSDGNKVLELMQDRPVGLVDSRGDDGNTALLIALGRRDEQWTGFLLNHGADPNLAARNGDTPLMVAAKAGYFDGLGWLLGLGAKVDATNKSGETALILAVQQRQPMIVQALLKAGADPDKADHVAGFSARDYAARDPRARDVVRIINSIKPKAALKP
ncbi:MAG: ankyrin repeat domain-containing protein [Sphingomicrobium sp.]